LKRQEITKGKGQDVEKGIKSPFSLSHAHTYYSKKCQIKKLISYDFCLKGLSDCGWNSGCCRWLCLVSTAMNFRVLQNLENFRDYGLARTRRNCTVSYRPALSSESALQNNKPRNCLKEISRRKKNWSRVPDRRLTPRQTG
jgi:hypothetical protein